VRPSTSPQTAWPFTFMVIAGIDGPPNWPPPVESGPCIAAIDSHVSGGEFSFRRAHTHPLFDYRQVRQLDRAEDIRERKHNVAAHT
jgi:hypothetical protein